MDQHSKNQFAYANMLIQRGDFDEAIKFGQTVQHPVVRSVVLGAAHMERQNVAEAEQHFREARNALPNDPTILEYLACCHALLNGGVYDSTCEDLINRAFPENQPYHHLYTRVLLATGSPVRLKRRHRFAWLCEQYAAVRHLNGALAECGCFRGASILLLCSYEQSYTPSFSGHNVHVFDSFEGLSKPGTNDGAGRGDSVAGAFAAAIEDVQEALSGFPEITFHKGWIPERFQDVETKRFRFVHVDVDLFQPTNDSVRFFFDRLVPGGRLICDDYNWSGAKDAIDVFVAERGIEIVSSPHGQAMLIKA
jgi:O-methyltransferase